MQRPCMDFKDNSFVCTKDYPKSEYEETKVDGTNYPKDRRTPAEGRVKNTAVWMKKQGGHGKLAIGDKGSN